MKELEKKVGYATTSILEDFVEEYIKENTFDGKFKGDWYYIIVYDQLKKYNATADLK